MIFSPQTAVTLAFFLEVLLLILLVPLVLKVSQWEATFRLQKDTRLLELRTFRKEIKALRYAVEATPDLYAWPVLKQWPWNPLRWMLPYFLK